MMIKLYRNTTSIGYNQRFDRLLVSHCACQAPPVWLIWCDVNSTGFQFGRGYPTNCARWHTNAPHSLAPSFLTELCVPVAAVPGRMQLRSAARGDLVIPATRTKTIGPRGFLYACPFTWKRFAYAFERLFHHFHNFQKTAENFFILEILITVWITAHAFEAICLIGVQQISVQ